jgi:hypothetical protein
VGDSAARHAREGRVKIVAFKSGEGLAEELKKALA